MRRIDLAVAVLVGVLLSSPALAESTSQSPPSFGGCIGLLVLYFCAKHRVQEIGGWLLYFYIQLYLGAVILPFVFLAGLDNYRPSSWVGAPGLYWWFLASTVPTQLALVLQVILAEKLRRSRDAKWLEWLRRAFWLDLAFVGVGFAIDMVHFRDSLLFDGIALLWPAIWLPYLYISKRVRRVFVLKDWVTPPIVPSLGLAPGGPTKSGPSGVAG